MLWPFALVLAALCWYGEFRWRRRRLYELAARIPGSPELPFIGHANQLIGSTEKIMRQLKEYSYFAINNKGIFKGWLGHLLYFILVDPIDADVILKSCLEKDDLHRFMRTVIGYGGIFAPVSIWRRRRKTMIPVFSPRVLDHFMDIFATQSQTLAERLTEQDGAEPFSVWPFLSAYTLDSVCGT
ncbi:Cytochrome P450 4c3 [Eumeta japonica]|uniref:Cytochrome P450 4c3 n=1 Tax=Eumeta variegata TaxID=151549 RepID=A0A4C1V2W0_EUMVA|nr:Cytochrome P450 4c3 [Eumeta japonica]